MAKKSPRKSKEVCICEAAKKHFAGYRDARWWCPQHGVQWVSSPSTRTEEYQSRDLAVARLNQVCQAGFRGQLILGDRATPTRVIVFLTDKQVSWAALPIAPRPLRETSGRKRS